MSRLIDPGPGEILDRLTILALKVVYGMQAGRDCAHWEQEQAALGTQLPRSKAATRALLQLLELAAVNAALWQAEDELRRLRNLPEAARPQWTGSGGNVWVVDVANAALRIQALNDRRAALITRINVAGGVDRPGEKV